MNLDNSDHTNDRGMRLLYLNFCKNLRIYKIAYKGFSGENEIGINIFATHEGDICVCNCVVDFCWFNLNGTFLHWRSGLTLCHLLRTSETEMRCLYEHSLTTANRISNFCLQILRKLPFAIFTNAVKGYNSLRAWYDLWYSLERS